MSNIIYFSIFFAFIVILGNGDLSVFGENGEDEIYLDGLTPIINLVIAIAGFSGVAGLFWGIYEYRESPGVLDFVKNYDYRWNDELPQSVK